MSVIKRLGLFPHDYILFFPPANHEIRELQFKTSKCPLKVTIYISQRISGK
jgi:hypothetical protein